MSYRAIPTGRKLLAGRITWMRRPTLDRPWWHFLMATTRSGQHTVSLWGQFAYRPDRQGD